MTIQQSSAARMLRGPNANEQRLERNEHSTCGWRPGKFGGGGSLGDSVATCCPARNLADNSRSSRSGTDHLQCRADSRLVLEWMADSDLRSGRCAGGDWVWGNRVVCSVPLQTHRLTRGRKMTDEPKPATSKVSGGCSLGCAGLFVAAGLVWPLMHFVGGSKEPDEALLLPIVIGGPAFLVAHVLAIVAIRSGSPGTVLRGRRSLLVMWGGIALVASIGLLAWLTQLIRG